MRFFFLFFASTLLACTDFVVRAKEGTLVNGRSLEFAMELQSKVAVFPRGARYSSLAPSGQKGLQWVSRYGFLGVTALGKDLAMDGLNEAGLSFGYLWLPGFTEYPTVSPIEMGQALDFVDFGIWLLSNFATVAEVKEGLAGVRVWGHAVPPLPGIPPVHVAIHDAQGKHLVVEFIKGEMRVYDNPNSVLTNSPPFDWHFLNLQNYVHLSAQNANPISTPAGPLAPLGQGSGMLGLPGDWTPPSRFVKIATLLRFVKEVADAPAAVNLAAHLLNTVDIPKGAVQEGPQGGGDYTQWAVIKDLTHRVFYFRCYGDLTLKKLDLKKLRFDGSEGRIGIALDTKKETIDLTPLLQGKNSLSVMKE